ncbi:MAG: ATP synthase F1 subunit gamma [Ignavibacteria bacterium]
MSTLREIKRRITSIKSIEKITRAMKMVAAVKFRKAQEAILAARPYAWKIDEMMKFLLPTVEDVENELLAEREIKRIAVVVVAADRGLCGSFNSNLIKTAQNIINTKYSGFYNSRDLSVITIGKKSFDFFSKRDYDIYAKYTGIFDTLNFESVKEIVNDILSGYREKKFDKIITIYNEFKSVIQSKIIEEQFLPIISFTAKEETSESDKPAEDKTDKFKTNYIFEPSAVEIINYLLPKHLNTQMWRILLESNASEQASRMTAMDSATTNAQDLISSLQLNYNRARQSAITKEILEVVGGAEALKEVSS